MLLCRHNSIGLILACEPDVKLFEILGTDHDHSLVLAAVPEFNIGTQALARLTFIRDLVSHLVGHSIFDVNNLLILVHDHQSVQGRRHIVRGTYRNEVLATQMRFNLGSTGFVLLWSFLER